MRIDFDKLNKLTLPLTILIASIILGGFFYASQVNKQRSIERQEKVKTEQKYKEYVAKRRLECYELYKERDRLRSNVEGYFYREKGYGLFESDDVCVIRYKNLDWKESNPLEDKYFTKEY